jgi:hypothetical protein
MSTTPAEPRRTMFDRLDDAMNPIVVKELRQAVQSRFVVAVLLIFLMLQLLWIGVRLLIFGVQAEFESIEFQAGREVFAAQQGILLFTCMVFLPLYTGIRLAAERNDANTDLLYVTTIKPGAIIFGKLLSAIVLAVLILSACMPFMALTYYLRGIDWPSIVVILGIDLLVVFASVQAMVFLAVIPCGRVFKSMLAIAGLVSLCFVFYWTLKGTADLSRTGVSSLFRDPLFWMSAVNFVFVMLAICGLLYTWSIAMLGVPSANRALPVRIFALLLWGASLVLTIVEAAYMGGPFTLLPIQIWTSVMTMFACLNLAIAIGERRNFSPRLMRTIPRWGIFRRLAFLFYSGAAGGVLFATLMMAMTLVAAVTLGYWLPGSDIWDWVGIAGNTSPQADEFFMVLAVCTIGFLYTFAYALTAVFLRSHVLRQLPTVMTPLVAIVLVGIGSVAPWFIGSMIYLQSWRFDDQHYWLLANPFTALVEFASMNRVNHNLQKELDYAVFAAGWAFVAFLVNTPWVFAQFRRFRRPVEAPVAPKVEPQLEPQFEATPTHG